MDDDFWNLSVDHTDPVFDGAALLRVGRQGASGNFVIGAGSEDRLELEFAIRVERQRLDVEDEARATVLFIHRQRHHQAGTDQPGDLARDLAGRAVDVDVADVGGRNRADLI